MFGDWDMHWHNVPFVGTYDMSPHAFHHGTGIGHLAGQPVGDCERLLVVAVAVVAVVVVESSYGPPSPLSAFPVEGWSER